MMISDNKIDVNMEQVACETLSIGSLELVVVHSTLIRRLYTPEYSPAW